MLGRRQTKNDSTIFVVCNNKGFLLSHSNGCCRCISVPLHIFFIPGEPLIWGVSAAHVAEGESHGETRNSSQGFHWEVTHVTSYYLNGRCKWHGQASVQVLLRSGTSFLSEQIRHIEALLQLKCFLSSEVVSFSDVSRNTRYKFSSPSHPGFQGYRTRDGEKCFSRASTVLITRKYVQICESPSAWDRNSQALW